MRGDDKFAHRFVGWGASDDCAGLSGATDKHGEEIDESEGCHNWFELKVNGEVVGECMMNYESGWEFRFRSNTHSMEAGKILRRWDES